MRILFVVPYTPNRIRTRPLHMIRALRSAGHDVTVATLWTSDEERAGLGELGLAPDRLIAEDQPLARSGWNCLRALAGSEPLQAHYSWNPRLAARLRQAVDDTAFDVVHVEHLRGVRYGLMLSSLLSGRPRRPALIWDSVDCISLLFERAALASQVPQARLAARVELPRTRRYESWVGSRFDRLVVTSDADRAEFLRLAQPTSDGRPATRVDVVPNGVDLDYFSPAPEVREPLTLVITGKMSYHANVSAVRWLVDEVMPRVWSALPAARLWVVGKDPPRDLRKLGQPSHRPVDAASAVIPEARVVVTGTVADVRPFLHKAALALAPIQYGVGIQNKVLEAMACGTPVVATAKAVGSLHAQPGSEMVVASTPAEFAQAVVTLLEDPARRDRLGRAGRAFTEREHDWRQVGAAMTEIYRHARQ
ncbi:MAG TPA: glycosyltransferase [Actinomycetes bacterium]|nr:glycosyltransferase [Actinomycetes bacterium]